MACNCTYIIRGFLLWPSVHIWRGYNLWGLFSKKKLVKTNRRDFWSGILYFHFVRQNTEWSLGKELCSRALVCSCFIVLKYILLICSRYNHEDGSAFSPEAFSTYLLPAWLLCSWAWNSFRQKRNYSACQINGVVVKALNFILTGCPGNIFQVWNRYFCNQPFAWKGWESFACPMCSWYFIPKVVHRLWGTVCKHTYVIVSKSAIRADMLAPAFLPLPYLSLLHHLFLACFYKLISRSFLLTSHSFA